MAAAKKSTPAKKKAAVKKSAVKRPSSEGMSPVDPSHPLPARAVSYRDLNKGQQRDLERAVGAAGKEAFGSKITLEDATNARISAIQSAIDRSPTGVPEGLGWYEGHQGSHRGISEETGVSLGRVIDASATLSPRNRPANELRAARSAAFIAGNPEHRVTITPEMSPHVGEFSKGQGGRLVTRPTGRSGEVSLGELSPHEAASLANAEKLARAEGDTSPALDTRITEVSNRSAGRGRAQAAIRIARGEPFDEVSGEAPKMRNYARAAHLADPRERNFNAEVLARRRLVENDPNQGFLFPASALLGEHTPTDQSVEDYVMGSMTAQTASQKGKKGVASREAQNIVNVKKKDNKGKSLLPVNMTGEEGFHALGEEATRRAAQAIGYTGIVHDVMGGDQFREHITTAAAQPISWVEHQRHTLGEDEAYNSQLKDQEASEKKKQKESEFWSKQQTSLF